MLSFERITRFKNDVDFEKKQYQLLADLKVVQDRFNKNQLYPDLSDLVTFYHNVRMYLEKRKHIDTDMLKKAEMKAVDFESRQIIRDDFTNMINQNVQTIHDLFVWILPFVQQKIAEGVAIHDFVEEQMVLSQIGIWPNYKKEGYLFLPSKSEEKDLGWIQNVFGYKFTIWKQENTKLFSSLNFNLVCTEDFKIPPLSLKRRLIKENPQLPVPATVILEKDEDYTLDAFSFENTVLPIAKRQLIDFVLLN